MRMKRIQNQAGKRQEGITGLAHTVTKTEGRLHESIRDTPGEQNTPEHNQGNETGCKKTAQKQHKYPNTTGSN